ncbi:hypothetical protein BG015_007538 [Linnemannia schmuckeri]|uniref:Uncharacterized protein n=1 Tax=Linnemannia schmuckeri TaxID=64567 RepID=A0A9P5S0I3_9FUNG|nr:hypothetical protein BG015_007538 [Linnemannia schmuckeri]
MSVESAIKLNVILKTMPCLKHLVVRASLSGFTVFEGLRRVKIGLPRSTDKWKLIQPWSHYLQEESSRPWLETIEVF